MQLKFCKLQFKTPLHLGIRENWLESTDTQVHSDTLYSAICHAWRLLYGSESLEHDLLKNQSVLISSCFPWWKDRFYLPFARNLFPSDKDLKKVRYIEKSDWEKILAGQDFNNSMDRLPRPGASYNEDSPISPPQTPWKVYETPRIGVNRQNNMTDQAFYFLSQIEFMEDAGLYFFYDVDTKINDRWLAALRLMADEGLGGDRSVGKGWMHPPQFSAMDISSPVNADGCILLSLYYPLDSEYSVLQKGYYELIERRGYIYSPDGTSLQRQPVRMITEGSVFPVQPEQMVGGIVDVTPEIFNSHRVYRYGRAFGIPCMTGGLCETKTQN